MTSTSLMHEAGHSKLVLWDNPEGCDGEGGGRGVSGWRDTCIHVNVWQNHHKNCKVISLQLKYYLKI